MARSRRWVVLFAAVAAMLVVSVPSASAAVSRDGWGVGIADDMIDWGPLDFPDLGEGFTRLNTEVFRFQTPWNTMEGNAAEGGTDHNALKRAEWRQRNTRLFAKLEAQGVQQIVLTVRGNYPDNVSGRGDYIPSVAEYHAKINALVQAYAPYVDAWGPANEPNYAWRPGDAPGGKANLPAARLASFYNVMKAAVAAHDPSALVTSPDFHDRLDQFGVARAPSAYISEYLAYNGGWGDAVAWHPYYSIQHHQMGATNELASMIGAKPIWVTEVGSGPKDASETFYESTQTLGVNWLLNTLGAHAKVTKLMYYDMRGPDHGWNTGLLNPDYTPRQAWRTWCAATHGNNPSHPDCTGYPPPPPPPPPRTPTSSAAFAENGVQYYYYRGADGALWQWQYNGAWHQTRIGGALAAGAEPTVYSINGNHHVYFRGSDGAVWQYVWQTNIQSWVLTRLGGSASDDPIGYVRDGMQFVYFRGTDGAIWEWHWNGAWNLGRLGGSAAPGQLAAYDLNGNHHVYFRGSDGAIWQWLWQANISSWILTRLGGSASGEPIAYTHNGLQFVYFRGSDGAIWEWYWNGAWNLGRLGGSAAVGAQPTGYNLNGNHHLYFRGSDGAIWQWLWQANISSWILSRLGGAAAGDPASLHSGGLYFLYFRGADGASWQWYWNGAWNLGRLG